MTIQTLEEQIVAEYGMVRGWIAVHPLLAMVAALSLGWLAGYFLGLP